jgi:3-oxoacyl-[acyl-carrier protein] reductase
MVETEMTKDLPPESMADAKKEAVLGRIAAAQDVADLVAFLCSDRAANITGECIRVDAGQYI